MNTKKIVRPITAKVVSGLVRSGTQSQGQTITQPQGGTTYDDTYSVASGGLIRAGIS